jgi:HEAT repeat protein
MRLHPRTLLLAGWFLGLCGTAAGADANPALGPDERILQAANLKADGPALLEFFRARTPTPAADAKLAAAAKLLGDPSNEVRQHASDELIAAGPRAAPLLEQARKSTDAELAFRANLILSKIRANQGTRADLAVAAARLVARRKPAGAAEVLLAYLPGAAAEGVAEEVQAALNAVALRDGKPEAVLVRALRDEQPLKRAAAAEALLRAGPGTRAAVRPLLQDAEPAVRLRVALTLAAFKEAEAVPVLIAALAGGPEDQARQAEDFLVRLAGPQAPPVPLGHDEAARQKCGRAWAAWWAAVDRAALLDFFRRRTLTEAGRERLAALVRQLGHKSFKARETAMTELVALRRAAADRLRQALTEPDPEVRRRAGQCLKMIEAGPPESPLLSADARLLAVLKLAGAAGVLLAYLPFAEDESVGEEVRDALAAVAVREGKSEEVLVQALRDKLPLKRGAAAEALLRSGAPGARAAARPLLNDPEPEVRLRTALALTGLKEPDAVPVLIALLGELPAAQLWQAEDLLRRLAGEQAPSVPLGGDEAARRKCRAAWAAWWKDQGDRADWAGLETGPRLLGYTLLVVQKDNNGPNGRVVELSPGGVPRWQITGLHYPLDAQVLPGDRVLIAEANGNRVTERNLKGDILWKKDVPYPIACQRLLNGNVFVANRDRIYEFDRAGQEVASVPLPAGSLTAAQKLRDGQVGYLTGSTFVRLDASGKELKRCGIGNVQTVGGMDVLPSGRVVVVHVWGNKVVEYDGAGTAVWEANVQHPTSVVRLPNGNTLVSCYDTGQVVELDLRGKPVWEYKVSGEMSRARRR